MLLSEVKAGRLPKSELNVYHVVYEDRIFNAKGENLSHPVLQKYDIREWGSMPNEKVWDYLESLRTSSDNRFTYTVLFDPTEKKSEEIKDVAEDTKEPDGSDTVEIEVKKAPKGGRSKKDTINLG
jgi:hypothetical protein